MPNVTITVDGNTVFDRECVSFDCEQAAYGSAGGVLVACGEFPPVARQLSAPTGTVLENCEGLA